MAEVVAIIGASDKSDRYANKAMHALRKQGHDVVLINPFKEEIAGRKCLKSIDEYAGKIDTVALYVNPTRFQNYIEGVIKAGPKRVIMNPGTENDEHERTLQAAGIEAVQACTLVLLSTGRF